MFLSFMASRRGHLFQGLGGLCSEVVLTRDFHNASQPREFLSPQSDLERSSNHSRHSLGKQPSPCRKNVSQLHVLLVTNLETRRPVITWKQEQCPSLFNLSLSKFSWNSAEKQAYVFGRVFLDICDSQRDYITNHTQILFYLALYYIAETDFWY